MEEPPQGRVIGRYVVAETTGRGLGQALLAALISECRAEQLESLVLTVTAGNEAARRLDKRAGFCCFGTEPDAVRIAGVSYAKHHQHLALTPS